MNKKGFEMTALMWLILIAVLMIVIFTIISINSNTIGDIASALLDRMRFG